MSDARSLSHEVIERAREAGRRANRPPGQMWSDVEKGTDAAVRVVLEHLRRRYQMLYEAWDDPQDVTHSGKALAAAYKQAVDELDELLKGLGDA